jgi:hypothetical protein
MEESLKSNRTCQECHTKARPGRPVNFDREDRKYLHGSCRGAGKPFSHGKINRQYAEGNMTAKERLANAAIRAGKNVGTARSVVRQIDDSRKAAAAAKAAKELAKAEAEAEVK